MFPLYMILAMKTHHLSHLHTSFFMSSCAMHDILRNLLFPSWFTFVVGVFITLLEILCWVWGFRSLGSLDESFLMFQRLYCVHCQESSGPIPWDTVPHPRRPESSILPPESSKLWFFVYLLMAFSVCGWRLDVNMSEVQLQTADMQ